jgi:RimJ/RimL family protein N-acetyltransferase
MDSPRSGALSENDGVEIAADEFETDRLVVRRLQADDLEALLAVYTSNSDYLQFTEGSGDEPGRYDIEMLERDVAVAQMTPGRQMAGIFLKQTGELIGVLDWMDENPSDGQPWIGLVMIRADWQRRGLAAEAFGGLADRLRSRGMSVLRAAVIQRNRAGRALAELLGFQTVSTTMKRLASGEEELIVLERRLE